MFKFKDNFWHVLLLLAISFSFAFVGGYSFGEGNHEYQLPLIYQEMGEDFHENDLYSKYSISNTYFYNIVGFLGRFFDFGILFFVLYLVSSLLFVIAIYKIAVLLFNDMYVGYIASLLLVISKYSLGTELTFRNSFYHITLAMPILLFSLYYFLNKRYYLSAVLLAVGFNIHALSGLYLLILYSLYFLFSPKEINRKVILSGPLFFALVTPLIVSAPGGFSWFSVDGSWLSVMKAIDHSHAFPLNWSLSLYRTGFVIILLGVFLFFFFKKIGIKSKLDSDVIKLCYGFVPMFLTGFIFSEIYPVEQPIVFQFFRSSVFLSYIVIIYSSYLVYYLFIHRKNLIGLAVACFFAASLFYADDLPIYLAILFLTYIFFLKNRVRYSFYYLVAAFVLLVVFLIIFAPQKFVDVLVRLSYPIYIAVFVFLAVFLYKKFKSFNFDCLFFIFVIVVLVFSSFIYVVDTYGYSDVVGVYKKHINLGFKNDNSEWLDVLSWVKENSSSEDLFLVPIYRTGFRQFTHRSAFVVYGDVGHVFFNKEFGLEAYERLNIFGVDVEDLKYRNSPILVDKYNSITKDKIINISKDYGVNYAIFEAYKIVDFPVVYRNDGYVIYLV